MIEIKNLTKAFDGRTVLNDINAVFETGKTNLIIGRSGSGKTVMLKSIIGLIHPDEGEVLYDGRNIVRMGKTELNLLRRETGVLFQGSALFDSMTVLENVMFPLDMFSKETAREREKRARFCLERVNLSEACDLYPSEISGGMMKRAAIARAIALQPQYLLCDEPNSGLDPRTSLVIDNLIHSITKEYNMTTIINTHDMNSVMNMSENIVFIKEGVKEWQGTKEQVVSSNNRALNDFIFTVMCMYRLLCRFFFGRGFGYHCRITGALFARTAGLGCRLPRLSRQHVFVEVDQFDKAHGGIVAGTCTRLNDTGISARTLHHLRRYFGKKDFHRIFVLQRSKYDTL